MKSKEKNKERDLLTLHVLTSFQQRRNYRILSEFYKDKIMGELISYLKKRYTEMQNLVDSNLYPFVSEGYYTKERIEELLGRKMELIVFVEKEDDEWETINTQENENWVDEVKTTQIGGMCNKTSIYDGLHLERSSDGRLNTVMFTSTLTEEHQDEVTQNLHNSINQRSTVDEDMVSETVTKRAYTSQLKYYKITGKNERPIGVDVYYANNNDILVLPDIGKVQVNRKLSFDYLYNSTYGNFHNWRYFLERRYVRMMANHDYRRLVMLTPDGTTKDKFYQRYHTFFGHVVDEIPVLKISDVLDEDSIEDLGGCISNSGVMVGNYLFAEIMVTDAFGVYEDGTSAGILQALGRESVTFYRLSGDMNMENLNLPVLTTSCFTQIYSNKPTVVATDAYDNFEKLYELFVANAKATKDFEDKNAEKQETADAVTNSLKMSLTMSVSAIVMILSQFGFGKLGDLPFVKNNKILSIATQFAPQALTVGVNLIATGFLKLINKNLGKLNRRISTSVAA